MSYATYSIPTAEEVRDLVMKVKEQFPGMAGQGLPGMPGFEPPLITANGASVTVLGVEDEEAAEAVLKQLKQVGHDMRLGRI
jgi:hypothetical protein